MVLCTEPTPGPVGGEARKDEGTAAGRGGTSAGSSEGDRRVHGSRSPSPFSPEAATVRSRSGPEGPRAPSGFLRGRWKLGCDFADDADVNRVLTSTWRCSAVRVLCGASANPRQGGLLPAGGGDERKSVPTESAYQVLTDGSVVISIGGTTTSTPSDLPPSEVTMCYTRKHRVLRWFADTFFQLSVVALLALVESGYISSSPTGFYCNDPKISFKANGDTVSAYVLLGGSFLIPLIVLFTVEALMYPCENYPEVLTVWQCIKKGAVLAWSWYREYIIGFYVTMLITDATKLLVAEPRPHFLDTCKPDALSLCNSTDMYIDKFTCTNKVDTRWKVRDSMRSFPSGHTSLSVYMSLFLMYFLRRRLLPDITHLLVPWLHGLLMLWALTCSLTRITDHRHHWWDVLCGAIVGIVGALYTIRVLCLNFNPHRDCPASSVSKRTAPPPLLNGSAAVNGPKHSATLNGIPTVPGSNLVNDNGPARRLLSTSSSCASSVNTEERELREVSTS